jgi:hypothetical protein
MDYAGCCPEKYPVHKHPAKIKSQDKGRTQGIWPNQSKKRLTKMTEPDNEINSSCG